MTRDGRKRSRIDVDNVRLLESETAKAYGIPFDENWYSISKAAREQMIASRLARKTIDNLQAMQATANASRGK